MVKRPSSLVLFREAARPVTATRVLPDQFEAIDADLLFKDGATRRLKPVQSTAGAGNDIGVSSGDAQGGSNADSGDNLLETGAKDGAGKKGRVHVVGTGLLLDSVNETTLKPLGGTQIDLLGGVDGPHTEFFADTPQGKVQLTKNGAPNIPPSITAAVDASRSVESLTAVSGGVGPPATGAVGQFPVLVYPAAISREARAQTAMPVDYRQGPGDQLSIQLKYTVGVGANTTVRITTYGSIENNTIGTADFNLDVSSVTPDTIVTSPIIRTFGPATAQRLNEIAMIIRRTTFGGEFTGDFKLVSVIFGYESLSVSSNLSETAELFQATDQPPPTPGSIGSFQSNDYPAGVISESKCTFNIPQQFDPTTDAFLRLNYAMSTAVGGLRVDLSIKGSVNNVTTLAPQTVQIFPDNISNTIVLTAPLRFFSGLQRLDEIVIFLRRLDTDTHTGAFKLVSAELVMGSTIITGGVQAEVDYEFSDIIAGAGPPDTDTSATLGSENEVYHTATGLGDNQDVTLVARCRVPSALHGVSFIRVVHKVSAAAGNNGVIVTVRKADGTVVYTSTAQVSATRAEFVISGASLSSNPASGERFLVLAQAIVDTGATTYVGVEVTVGYN